MRTPVAIAINDIRLMARDRVALFFTVVFPLIVGLLFGVIFQGVVRGAAGDFQVDAGLIDLDQSEWSARLIERLDGLETVRWQRVESVEAGEELVRAGSLPAIVVLPKGMGARAGNLFAGESVEVELIVDPSRGPEQATLRGLITQEGFAMLFGSIPDAEQLSTMLEGARRTLATSQANPAERLALTGLVGAAERWIATRPLNDAEGTDSNPDTVPGSEVGATEQNFAFAPIAVKVRAMSRGSDLPRPASAYEITFPQAAGWALLGCVTGFGASLASERTRGTLIRLEVAPIPRWQVLTGKALACFSTTLCVQILLLVVGVLLLGVRVGSPLLLGIAVLSSCWAFTGLMMLLAAIGGSAAGSDGLSRGVLLVMALLGGAGVPLAFMPEWLRMVASVSPFKWVILALEGAIWRDWNMMQMLLPCGVLMGIGAVCFAIGTAAFRWDGASD